MDESPNLTSLGGRCLNGGMSFIWVREKFPCLIPYDMRFIVILDLEGVIPVYSAELEESNQIVGTYELALNALETDVAFQLAKVARFTRKYPAYLARFALS